MTARHWAGFDLVRVLAALAVVVSHAVYLSGAPEPVALGWGIEPWSLGVCGVAAFFVTSGYLVTRSWIDDPDMGRFARRRAARVWPALVVVVLATTFVVGPLVTDLAARDYLADGTTWAYSARNLVLVTALYLPGVFEANHVAVVNGSLWSLPLEVGCYLGVVVLGATGGLRRRRTVVAAAAVALALAWALDAGLLGLGAGAGTIVRLGPPLVALFLLGAALLVLRVRRSRWIAAAALLVLVAVRDLPLSGLGYVAIAYLVVWVGTAQWSLAARLRRLGDPSYGAFLVGWPVSQLLVGAGVASTTWLVALSCILALAAGYASWWTLEQRALRVGRSRSPRTSLAPASPAATG